MDCKRCIEEIEVEKQWRLNELYYMRESYKDIIKKNEEEKDISKENTKEYLIYTRMVIPLIYAHWEGFAKFSFENLIKFINGQKILSKNIIVSIFTHAQKEFFDKLKGKQSFGDKCLFSNNFLEIIEKTVNIKSKIDTKSNLNYNNLKEVLDLFSINPDSYHSYKSDIDRLVHLRNAVCHGELAVQLNIDDVEKYINRITELMDIIILEIENYISNKKYLIDTNHKDKSTF